MEPVRIKSNARKSTYSGKPSAANQEQLRMRQALRQEPSANHGPVIMSATSWKRSGWSLSARVRQSSREELLTPMVINNHKESSPDATVSNGDLSSRSVNTEDVANSGMKSDDQRSVWSLFSAPKVHENINGKASEVDSMSNSSGRAHDKVSTPTIVHNDPSRDPRIKREASEIEESTKISSPSFSLFSKMKPLKKSSRNFFAHLSKKLDVSVNEDAGKTSKADKVLSDTQGDRQNDAAEVHDSRLGNRTTGVLRKGNLGDSSAGTRKMDKHERNRRRLSLREQVTAQLNRERTDGNREEKENSGVVEHSRISESNSHMTNVEGKSALSSKAESVPKNCTQDEDSSFGGVTGQTISLRKQGEEPSKDLTMPTLTLPADIELNDSTSNVSNELDESECLFIDEEAHADDPSDSDEDSTKVEDEGKSHVLRVWSLKSDGESSKDFQNVDLGSSFSGDANSSLGLSESFQSTGSDSLNSSIVSQTEKDARSAERLHEGENSGALSKNSREKNLKTINAAHENAKRSMSLRRSSEEGPPKLQAQPDTHHLLQELDSLLECSTLKSDSRSDLNLEASEDSNMQLEASEDSNLNLEAIEDSNLNLEASEDSNLQPEASEDESETDSLDHSKESESASSSVAESARNIFSLFSSGRKPLPPRNIVKLDNFNPTEQFTRSLPLSAPSKDSIVISGSCSDERKSLTEGNETDNASSSNKTPDTGLPTLSSPTSHDTPVIALSGTESSETGLTTSSNVELADTQIPSLTPETDTRDGQAAEQNNICLRSSQPPELCLEENLPSPGEKGASETSPVSPVAEEDSVDDIPFLAFETRDDLFSYSKTMRLKLQRKSTQTTKVPAKKFIYPAVKNVKMKKRKKNPVEAKIKALEQHLLRSMEICGLKEIVHPVLSRKGVALDKVRKHDLVVNVRNEELERTPHRKPKHNIKHSSKTAVRPTTDVRWHGKKLNSVQISGLKHGHNSSLHVRKSSADKDHDAEHVRKPLDTGKVVGLKHGHLQGLQKNISKVQSSGNSEKQTEIKRSKPKHSSSRQEWEICPEALHATSERPSLKLKFISKARANSTSPTKVEQSPLALSTKPRESTVPLKSPTSHIPVNVQQLHLPSSSVSTKNVISVTSKPVEEKAKPVEEKPPTSTRLPIEESLPFKPFEKPVASKKSAFVSDALEDLLQGFDISNKLKPLISPSTISVDAAKVVYKVPSRQSHSVKTLDMALKRQKPLKVSSPNTSNEKTPSGLSNPYHGWIDEKKKKKKKKKKEKHKEKRRIKEGYVFGTGPDDLVRKLPTLPFASYGRTYARPLFARDQKDSVTLGKKSEGVLEVRNVLSISGQATVKRQSDEMEVHSDEMTVSFVKKIKLEPEDVSEEQAPANENIPPILNINPQSGGKDGDVLKESSDVKSKESKTDDGQAPSKITAVKTCGEFCHLGCICDSLDNPRSVQEMSSHCRRVDCMFECVCKKSSSQVNTGTRIRRPPTHSHDMVFYDDSYKFWRVGDSESTSVEAKKLQLLDHLPACEKRNLASTCARTRRFVTDKPEKWIKWKRKQQKGEAAHLKKERTSELNANYQLTSEGSSAQNQGTEHKSRVIQHLPSENSNAHVASNKQRFIRLLGPSGQQNQGTNQTSKSNDPKSKVRNIPAQAAVPSHAGNSAQANASSAQKVTFLPVTKQYLLNGNLMNMVVLPNGNRVLLPASTCLPISVKPVEQKKTSTDAEIRGRSSTVEGSLSQTSTIPLRSAEPALNNSAQSTMQLGGFLGTPVLQTCSAVPNVTTGFQRPALPVQVQITSSGITVSPKVAEASSAPVTAERCSSSQETTAQANSKIIPKCGTATQPVVKARKEPGVQLNQPMAKSWKEPGVQRNLSQHKDLPQLSSTVNKISIPAQAYLVIKPPVKTNVCASVATTTPKLSDSRSSRQSYISVRSKSIDSVGRSAVSLQKQNRSVTKQGAEDCSPSESTSHKDKGEAPTVTKSLLGQSAMSRIRITKTLFVEIGHKPMYIMVFTDAEFEWTDTIEHKVEQAILKSFDLEKPKQSLHVRKDMKLNLFDKGDSWIRFHLTMHKPTEGSEHEMADESKRQTDNNTDAPDLSEEGNEKTKATTVKQLDSVATHVMSEEITQTNDQSSNIDDAMANSASNGSDTLQKHKSQYPQGDVPVTSQNAKETVSNGAERTPPAMSAASESKSRSEIHSKGTTSNAIARTIPNTQMTPGASQSSSGKISTTSKAPDESSSVSESGNEDSKKLSTTQMTSEASQSSSGKISTTSKTPDEALSISESGNEDSKKLSMTQMTPGASQSSSGKISTTSKAPDESPSVSESGNENLKKLSTTQMTPGASQSSSGKISTTSKAPDESLSISDSGNENSEKLSTSQMTPEASQSSSGKISATSKASNESPSMSESVKEDSKKLSSSLPEFDKLSKFVKQTSADDEEDGLSPRKKISRNVSDWLHEPKIQKSCDLQSYSGLKGPWFTTEKEGVQVVLQRNKNKKSPFGKGCKLISKPSPQRISKQPTTSSVLVISPTKRKPEETVYSGFDEEKVLHKGEVEEPRDICSVELEQNEKPESEQKGKRELLPRTDTNVAIKEKSSNLENQCHLPDSSGLLDSNAIDSEYVSTSQIDEKDEEASDVTINTSKNSSVNEKTMIGGQSEQQSADVASAGSNPSNVISHSPDAKFIDGKGEETQIGLEDTEGTLGIEHFARFSEEDAYEPLDFDEELSGSVDLAADYNDDSSSAASLRIDEDGFDDDITHDMSDADFGKSKLSSFKDHARESTEVKKLLSSPEDTILAETTPVKISNMLPKKSPVLNIKFVATSNENCTSPLCLSPVCPSPEGMSPLSEDAAEITQDISPDPVKSESTSPVTETTPVKKSNILPQKSPVLNIKFVATSNENCTSPVCPSPEAMSPLSEDAEITQDISPDPVKSESTSPVTEDPPVIGQERLTVKSKSPSPVFPFPSSEDVGNKTQETPTSPPKAKCPSPVFPFPLSEDVQDETQERPTSPMKSNYPSPGSTSPLSKDVQNETQERLTSPTKAKCPSPVFPFPLSEDVKDETQERPTSPIKSNYPSPGSTSPMSEDPAENTEDRLTVPTKLECTPLSDDLRGSTQDISSAPTKSESHSLQGTSPAEDLTESAQERSTTPINSKCPSPGSTAPLPEDAPATTHVRSATPTKSDSQSLQGTSPAEDLTETAQERSTTPIISKCPSPGSTAPLSEDASATTQDRSATPTKPKCTSVLSEDLTENKQERSSTPTSLEDPSVLSEDLTGNTQDQSTIPSKSKCLSPVCSSPLSSDLAEGTQERPVTPSKSHDPSPAATDATNPPSSSPSDTEIDVVNSGDDEEEEEIDVETVVGLAPAVQNLNPYSSLRDITLRLSSALQKEQRTVDKPKTIKRKSPGTSSLRLSIGHNMGSPRHGERKQSRLSMNPPTHVKLKLTGPASLRKKMQSSSSSTTNVKSKKKKSKRKSPVCPAKQWDSPQFKVVYKDSFGREVEEEEDRPNKSRNSSSHNFLERQRREELRKAFGKLNEVIDPQHTLPTPPKIQILKKAVVEIMQLEEKEKELQQKKAEVRKQQRRLVYVHSNLLHHARCSGQIVFPEGSRLAESMERIRSGMSKHLTSTLPEDDSCRESATDWQSKGTKRKAKDMEKLLDSQLAKEKGSTAKIDSSHLVIKKKKKSKDIGASSQSEQKNFNSPDEPAFVLSPKLKDKDEVRVRKGAHYLPVSRKDLKARLKYRDSAKVDTLHTTVSKDLSKPSGSQDYSDSRLGMPRLEDNDSSSDNEESLPIECYVSSSDEPEEADDLGFGMDDDEEMYSDDGFIPESDDESTAKVCDKKCDKSGTSDVDDEDRNRGDKSEPEIVTINIDLDDFEQESEESRSGVESSKEVESRKRAMPTIKQGTQRKEESSSESADSDDDVLFIAEKSDNSKHQKKQTERGILGNQDDRTVWKRHENKSQSQTVSLSRTGTMTKDVRTIPSGSKNSSGSRVSQDSSHSTKMIDSLENLSGIKQDKAPLVDVIDEIMNRLRGNAPSSAGSSAEECETDEGNGSGRAGVRVMDSSSVEEEEGHDKLVSESSTLSTIQGEDGKNTEISSKHKVTTLTSEEHRSIGGGNQLDSASLGESEMEMESNSIQHTEKNASAVLPKHEEDAQLSGVMLDRNDSSFGDEVDGQENTSASSAAPSDNVQNEEGKVRTMSLKTKEDADPRCVALDDSNSSSEDEDEEDEPESTIASKPVSMSSSLQEKENHREQESLPSTSHTNFAGEKNSDLSLQKKTSTLPMKGALADLISSVKTRVGNDDGTNASEDSESEDEEMEVEVEDNDSDDDSDDEGEESSEDEEMEVEEEREVAEDDSRSHGDAVKEDIPDIDKDKAGPSYASGEVGQRSEKPEPGGSSDMTNMTGSSSSAWRNEGGDKNQDRSSVDEAVNVSLSITEKDQRAEKDQEAEKQETSSTGDDVTGPPFINEIQDAFSVSEDTTDDDAACLSYAAMGNDEDNEALMDAENPSSPLSLDLNIASDDDIDDALNLDEDPRTSSFQLPEASSESIAGTSTEESKSRPQEARTEQSHAGSSKQDLTLDEAISFLNVEKNSDGTLNVFLKGDYDDEKLDELFEKPEVMDYIMSAAAKKS